MVLSIILGIVVLFLCFLYYRQDSTIKSQIDYINEMETKLLNTVTDVDSYLNKMKDIDQKGGFQSDDEVGQIFTGLKETIEDLNKIVKGEQSE